MVELTTYGFFAATDNAPEALPQISLASEAETASLTGRPMQQEPGFAAATGHGRQLEGIEQLRKFRQATSIATDPGSPAPKTPFASTMPPGKAAERLTIKPPFSI